MDSRNEELTRLAAIVDHIRDRCPWDREQTLATMAPCAQEEAAEVADAVAQGGVAAIREELGDLLMNVFLMARIAEQRGTFTLADVAREIGDKLIRRHPHVFGDAPAKDAEQAIANWDGIKAAERKSETASGAPRSALDGVPERASSLARAQKLGRKAAKTGFDWPDAGGAVAKLDEELGELEAARASGDRAACDHELGDVLFSVVNVARKLGLDADQALRGANDRFERRFHAVERTLGPRMAGASLETMENAWQAAKREPPG